MRYLIFGLFLCFHLTTTAQTWIDSLDHYARMEYRPPQLYFWTWNNSPLLHAMEYQYELLPEDQKQKYANYVRQAMNRNLVTANGLFPNGVASANGMAFMYRITGDQIYLDVAYRVLNDYRNILRTSNGGVSHIAYAPELWNDTVYMIGVFFLAMYRATGNEEYLDELIEQYKLHKEKLLVEEYGLWVHGWDGNNTYDLDFCSQPDWADPVTRRSHEMWGRGNGWVVVTLSELLNNLDQSHPEWDFLANSLKEMIINLPEYQDEETGHWYQLPFRAGEDGNYIESSCTAMFGYGILTALKYGIVSGEVFENAVTQAYYGLKEHSTTLTEVDGETFLTTTNVCKQTCIGDKDYYFNINTTNGKAYALAVFIIFGRAYQDLYLNDVTTNVINQTTINNSFQLFPNLISNYEVLHLKFTSDNTLKAIIQIVDVSGRKIDEKGFSISTGTNHATIPSDKLNKGNYFLILKSTQGQVLKTSPFTVQ